MESFQPVFRSRAGELAKGVGSHSSLRARSISPLLLVQPIFDVEAEIPPDYGGRQDGATPQPQAGQGVALLSIFLSTARIFFILKANARIGFN